MTLRLTAAALLLSASTAMAVTYTALPVLPTPFLPVGPDGEATRLYTTDVVVTSEDVNGTMHGQVEYVSSYSGLNFCSSIWSATWATNGTLVSQTQVSSGCQAPWLGVFVAQNLGQVQRPTLPAGVPHPLYSQWQIGPSNRPHWAAYYGH